MNPHLFYSWGSKKTHFSWIFIEIIFSSYAMMIKNYKLIWWATWIDVNHGVWCFVYWITILSLQFSLGLKPSEAFFNSCKICLPCLILQMKLVDFSLKNSHNSSLFIYLFISSFFLLRRPLKIDLLRGDLQAITILHFSKDYFYPPLLSMLCFLFYSQNYTK